MCRALQEKKTSVDTGTEAVSQSSPVIGDHGKPEDVMVPVRQRALPPFSEGWSGINVAPSLPPLELAAEERKGIHHSGNQGNSL